MKTLKKRSDFLNIAAKGHKRPIKSLILQALENNANELRIGYTVTKRTSKLSVDRNRIKRRLRAAVREVFPAHAKQGYDYVIIGKIDILTRDFDDLKNDLKYALRKIFSENI